MRYVVYGSISCELVGLIAQVGAVGVMTFCAHANSHRVHRLAFICPIACSIFLMQVSCPLVLYFLLNIFPTGSSPEQSP
jgi:hypothetical protein